MADIQNLTIVDASNTARFPENQAPSTVNDGARALEGIIARWHRDMNGSLSICGAANTWAVAMNRSISVSVTALYTGLSLRFRCNADVTGATTFALNGIAAQPVKKHRYLQLEAGDVRAGEIAEVTWDGNVWQLTQPLLARMPAGHLYGCKLSISGSTDVIVQTGKARDINDTQDLPFATSLRKSIGATWTAGTNAGGRDSFFAAVSASQWFHVWVMGKRESLSGTFTQDVIFNKATNVSLTASYSFARRIGSIQVNDAGTGLNLWEQDGDTFWWESPVLSLAQAALTPTSSARTFTVATPTGIETVAMLAVLVEGLANSRVVGVYVAPADTTNSVVSLSSSTTADQQVIPNVGIVMPGTVLSVTGVAVASSVLVKTDTSSQVRIRAQAPDTRVTVYTLGWIDRRGRDG